MTLLSSPLSHDQQHLEANQDLSLPATGAHPLLVTYLEPHHCPHPHRLSGHHFLAEGVLPDLQPVSHSPDIEHSRDPDIIITTESDEKFG